MVMTSQPDIAGTLPESWAEAGAFTELSELWLLDLPVVETLPASWGSNGFPAWLTWCYNSPWCMAHYRQNGAAMASKL